MGKRLLLLLLPLVACDSRAPQNTTEIMSEAMSGNAAVAAEAGEPAAENASTAAANRPTSVTVGPMQVPYDAALLAPERVTLPLPPDWKAKAQGVKLIARERAELIGKAECIYGGSGEASRCNADQEAGLAFASLPAPFAEISGRIPADGRKSISLAGVEGVSWEIGAEGEGAEYILLPAGSGTALIVRQFRTAGNPDEAAIGTVLSDLRLKQEP
ncbi:MAG TPA: hypothetical protein VGD10_04390 [Allosphingosinicella sp.]|uniref:hypothetical protein n=1 Tax=Allosphingosinicella sp. TaxID=2823234 RepID=UPI002EDA11A6